MTGEPFVLGGDVAAARADGVPIVGLETSVIGQGLPHPRNVECVERMTRATRDAGAIPAWVGVLDGAVRVGLSDGELSRIAEPGAAVKVARRDLPAAVARKELGATTVSATIWAAAKAEIAIAATGGIGGVHPGERPDVSADLLELARTPIMLVCSGPKSIVDPERTMERLDELGVSVVGYGVDRLPFFLARETDVPLDRRAERPEEAAALARAQQHLAVRSAILLCNPVPAADAMDRTELLAVTAEAQRRADRDHVTGAALTPFLLATLAELTGGRSLHANLALLEDNARVAAEVAVAVSNGR